MICVDYWSHFICTRGRLLFQKGGKCVSTLLRRFYDSWSSASPFYNSSCSACHLNISKDFLEQSLLFQIKKSGISVVTSNKRCEYASCNKYFERLVRCVNDTRPTWLPTYSAALEYGNTGSMIWESGEADAVSCDLHAAMLSAIVAIDTCRELCGVHICLSEYLFLSVFWPCVLKLYQYYWQSMTLTSTCFHPSHFWLFW